MFVICVSFLLKRQFTFLSLFLCFDGVTSILLSLRSPILSSVPSILLSSPPMEFIWDTVLPVLKFSFGSSSRFLLLC